MRILFTTPLPLPLGWGVENVVRYLAKSMMQLGHTTALLQPHCDVSLSQEDRERFNGGVYSFHYSSYPVWYRPRSWASITRSAYHVFKAIQQFRPDIVHVNFLGGIAAPLGVNMLLPHRWRVVVTLRGSELTIGPTRDSPLVIPWQKRVLQRAAAVTAISKASLEEAIACYPWIEPKATVVYNGIDVECLPQIDESNILASRRGVLFVGRLHPDKGVDVLLHAWRIVEDSGVGEPLYICGDGPEAENLRQLCHRLELRSVEFLGRKRFEELVHLYQTCTLLVLPSRTETFGNVLIEAGYFGCVCVATAVGGIPEVVGDTGILVAPDDVEALAEAICGFFKIDKEQQDLLRLKARERVMKHFTANKVAADYLALFEKLL